MFRVAIDGELCDLPDRAIIQIQKTFFDLEDITARGLTFTNKLTLPNTDKNLRLTGYPNRLATTNKAFERRKTFQLLTDSGRAITSGDVVISEHDEKKGTKIQLVEGHNFWSDAGSRLLQDLPLHSFDFVFNSVNMDARKTIASDVFVTALVDMGGNTALTDYNTTRPCYNWRALLDQISVDLEYTFDFGDVLQKTELGSVGNISNAQRFLVSDYKIRFQGVAQSGTFDFSGSTSIFAKAGNVSETGNVLNNALYPTSYIIKGTVRSGIGALIEFSNGAAVSVPAGDSRINYRTEEVDVSSNITITVTGDLTLLDVYFYSAIDEAAIFEESDSFDIAGFLVLADYNLPQLTYKEFIKTVSSMFFLDFTTDSNNRTVAWRYLPDRLDANAAKDFSEKVQRDNAYSYGGLYAKLNRLTYNNDSDIDEEIGRAFVTTDNENADDAKDLVMINGFSASTETNTASGTVIRAQIYNVTDFTREAVSNRILYLRTGGTFGINATFSEISFQALFSNHYVNFFLNTQRERAFEFSAYITQSDLRELIESPIIYISWLGGNFLVYSVEKFDMRSMCNLKAIKYG